MRSASEVDPQQQWEGLVGEIFTVLDKKKRGYLSRVELAHILHAMQAEIKLEIPDDLKLEASAKDARIPMVQLVKLLQSFSVQDLEDLKWFAESVVKVEAELRDVWQEAVRKWRESVHVLYDRNLHRYLLDSQPQRVSRWLLLRTSTETNAEDSSTGLLGLGISQQEVEVLFTNDTADDISKCTQQIMPFLEALNWWEKLSRIVLEELGESTTAAAEEVESNVVECLRSLNTLMTDNRDLACLLIHEDSLSMLTGAVIRSKVFSQSVMAEATSLILTLINWRIHESQRDYERECRQVIEKYLEMDFNPEEYNGDVERMILHEATETRAPRATHEKRKYTIADWVGSLLTLQSDFERGEMLDTLIKYDETRVLLKSEGGLREESIDPCQASLFSFGKVIPYILARLDVSAHHSVHEHRTPLRTHMLKFLLNMMIGSGDRGRRLFRAGGGIRVLMIVIRGNSWGSERDEISVDDEEDRDEEAELYQASQWIWQEPYESWPYVEVESAIQKQRHYAGDFLDDKFYGPKDRLLAAAFLEHLATDGLWGPQALVEEMFQCPYCIQILCRVKPPGCYLIKLMLSHPGFGEYLTHAAAAIAKVYAERALTPVYTADVSCHSIFPVLYPEDSPSGSAAFKQFRDEIVAVQTQNMTLRILANAYHNLQEQVREDRASRQTSSALAEKTEEEAPGEASHLEEDITECCKLLSLQLKMSQNEVSSMAVAIYMQIKDFTRRALLAVNQLPPVNQEDKNKAKSLEVSKTLPARPMYFGHYQMLINNQSNPGQATSRGIVSEHQAQMQSLTGAAEILFTGENRYLSDPSLFPHEFLIVLRVIQLVRIHEPKVPNFIVELQELLEQLTGYQSSFSFSDAENEIELAGADYPWRTGLAPLSTFRVAQVPLRRSHLKNFSRSSPLAVARGMLHLLQEYSALSLWDEEQTDDPGTRLMTKAEKSKSDQASSRRNVLLALCFNHMCFFHPKAVTLENSRDGLANRLGVTVEVLQQVVQVLSAPELQAPAKALASPDVTLPPEVKIQVDATSSAVSVLMVNTADKELAFVHMMGVWTLWANCCKDKTHVLTRTEPVGKYFSF
mmetsp:Transcript_18122/g.43535  ORF Transcript_18122/g.43535 Transcript_18122/m.43535 type:complete len:1082 (-) Transcript_18122:114-3359(-)